MEDRSMLSIPFSGKTEEVDYKLCPKGVQVINMFLNAWQVFDIETMYELIDDESKKKYTLEQARFDFYFLEFKEYVINGIKKYNNDFMFILSYGDWQDGDKEVKKIIISGKTFKIIMYKKGSPFKESAVDYF